MACAAPALGGEECVGVHFGDWRSTPRWICGGRTGNVLIGKNLGQSNRGSWVVACISIFGLGSADPLTSIETWRPNFPSLLPIISVFKLYAAMTYSCSPLDRPLHITGVPMKYCHIPLKKRLVFFPASLICSNVLLPKQPINRVRTNKWR